MSTPVADALARIKDVVDCYPQDDKLEAAYDAVEAALVKLRGAVRIALSCVPSDKPRAILTSAYETTA